MTKNSHTASDAKGTRILVVIGPLSGRGGIETCLRSIADEAERFGDSVHILALSPSWVDGSWHRELSYREVTNGSNSLKIQVFSGILPILREIRRVEPDVIVTIYSSLIPTSRLASALSGRHLPIVSWLHFSMAISQRTSLLRYAQGHICISSEITESVRGLSGIDNDKVFQVFNGVDVSSAEVVPRSEEGPLRLVYVGRLMIGKQKRTDLLLKLLSQVNGSWHLDVIGSGDDEPLLKSLAIELGILERITWHGWQADPWSALHSADVLLLTSAFEGFPMVLLEATARGIPCISVDCRSGPSDIIDEGKNGWLVPMNAEEIFTSRVQEIVNERERLPSIEMVCSTAERFSITESYKGFKRAVSQTIFGLPRA
ncbi:glycosyltransferase [Albibacillus kandeliae]|uniref:glycosyltransferase n=1 Tax=Albibacillus kandeliae TaxID=2174228 RepID=UPI000D696928|nr:glycosyltransferase [Albibacillus kandeliae]